MNAERPTNNPRLLDFRESLTAKDFYASINNNPKIMSVYPIKYKEIVVLHVCSSFRPAKAA